MATMARRSSSPYNRPEARDRGGFLFCCEEMGRAMGREVIVETEKYLIRDGRILNEIDSTYFLRSGDESGRFNYFALNYCPFCGRALSRGLWTAEKKK